MLLFYLKAVMKNFLIISFILFHVASVLAAEPDQLTFSWAFILKSGDGQIKALDFEAPEPVSEGELLRIYLELHGGAFVYLYLFDSREDLYLVFPPSGSFYNGEIPPGYKSYIPSGRKWFSLDNLKGTERFYLLASNERLAELEKLTDRFLMAKEPELKRQLVEKLDEISEKFAVGAVYDLEPAPVRAGEWLGGVDSLPLVNSHKILATGSYGAILDMVNK